MKSFIEYLAEAEESEKQGTFGALHLEAETRNNLRDWLEEHKIKELLDKDDYHCTIVFSTKSVPEVSDIPLKFPIKATVKEWKILGTDNLLCAVLESTRIVKLFDKTIEMGAKTDYPNFIPHISLAMNYEGDLPEDVPEFEIVFDKFKVGALDADFKYGDDDE
jgi:2'-5' RNA ligase